MLTKSKIFVSSAVILSTIILDQLSKALVLPSNVPSVCNSGIAFGLLSGFHNVLISTLVLSVIIYFFARERRRIAYFAFALLIGGSISNILDRFTRGCVVDFIQLPFWPTTFNLADTAISAGVFLFIFSILFKFEAKNPINLDH